MKKTHKIIALLSMFTSTLLLPSHTYPEKVILSTKIKKLFCYNNIVTHAHCIKCLSESTYFLSRLHSNHYHYKPCNIIQQNDCIQIDSTCFFNQTIRSCLQKMLKTGSLKPLIILLQEVKHYCLRTDSLFFHEFFLLIFTVHKQIILHECEESHYALKTLTLNDIIMISEKINQLPIAEVLNAIDMLVTELPPFLEKYEFNSKISWTKWFKKYWWVPPVFGVWFGLKILLRLQRQQFYYSPYASPKPSISLQPIITNDPALLEIRNEQKAFTIHTDSKENSLCIT